MSWKHGEHRKSLSGIGRFETIPGLARIADWCRPLSIEALREARNRVAGNEMDKPPFSRTQWLARLRTIGGMLVVVTTFFLDLRVSRFVHDVRILSGAAQYIVARHCP